ncbi:interleukin-17 receptor B isoform X2 [Cololabis saira]|uniref:interleukin-17 receptor B isoform X2 n=1 Tax=Cololabis saira TaxID=129043 RepID=UPI002AD47C57|nr:interleukin-17 receptor B isoform X2 [Cololabis saira]
MWEFTLIVLYCAATQMTSTEITVDCQEHHFFPNTSIHAPSKVAGLIVDLVTDDEKDVLNISWAINIDASTKNLEGTRIDISGEATLLCKYSPPFAKANLTGLKQEWFHHPVKVSYGSYNIEVSNEPLPPLGSGGTSESKSLVVPRRKQRHVTTMSTTVTTDFRLSGLRIVIILGVLAVLMILSSCYFIYKKCGASFLGFTELPSFSKDPVPVLVVYPAENAVFQQAVVALAEFLQRDGGCRVAIDMWQQERIAELGPMRWLAEQADAAHCVLIVSPRVETPSSRLRPSSPDRGLPGISIPAAAHDLYLLTLNMVASHAKSANKLSRFRVVQLNERDSRVCALPPELRACKTFWLMKDLDKLCRTIHAQKQVEKSISCLRFRSGHYYGKKSTLKLGEAVERQRGLHPSISREKQPPLFEHMGRKNLTNKCVDATNGLFYE